jgi:hypothetical protein
MIEMQSPYHRETLPCPRCGAAIDPSRLHLHLADAHNEPPAYGDRVRRGHVGVACACCAAPDTDLTSTD